MLPDAIDADLTATLGRGAGPLYALLAERLKREPGFDLLTVLAPSSTGDRLVRLFSSNTEQYPLGDADPVQDDRWFRRLFEEKQPVIANDPTEIRDWLPDYMEFVEMGYGALANLPVIVSGEAVGVMNLMASQGHFSRGNIEAIVAQAPLAALAILAREAPRQRLLLRPDSTGT